MTAFYVILGSLGSLRLPSRTELYTNIRDTTFTSRGREEANEEKLRRWKREQALFMQRWPEFFLGGDPWLGPNLSSDSEYFSL